MEWEEIYGRLAERRSDGVAFQALRDRVLGRAVTDLRGLGWHVVEDAVEDTCAEVIVKFDRARGAATFGGFVLGIYLNIRRGYRRVNPRTETLDDIDPPDPMPDETGIDRSDRLQTCLAQLPARERTIIQMRYEQDVQYDEVGRVLNIKASNARQIAARARAELRRCISAITAA